MNLSLIDQSSTVHVQSRSSDGQQLTNEAVESNVIHVQSVGPQTLLSTSSGFMNHSDILENPIFFILQKIN